MHLYLTFYQRFVHTWIDGRGVIRPTIKQRMSSNKIKLIVCASCGLVSTIKVQTVVTRMVEYQARSAIHKVMSVYICCKIYV